MGLAEKLSEWLLRRRERQEERNMRQVAAYFGSLLNKRRADAGAILQSVRDYRDCPEVTRKQAELLLEHRFFRYRVPDELSRMAGGHGRPERDPLRDA